MRTQSPYPDAATSGGLVRSERFYYDGIRRIQEVFVDPLVTADSAQGDPELSLLASQTLGGSMNAIDGMTAPAAFEVAQSGDGDPDDPDPEPPATVLVWLDREYVWDPGDRGGAASTSC